MTSFKLKVVAFAETLGNRNAGREYIFQNTVPIKEYGIRVQLTYNSVKIDNFFMSSRLGVCLLISYDLYSGKYMQCVSSVGKFKVQ